MSMDSFVLPLACSTSGSLLFPCSVFLSCKMGTLCLISQGSVKKRDIILGLSRRKELNGEH